MVSMPLLDTSPIDWPPTQQAAVGSWTTLTPEPSSHITSVFSIVHDINGNKNADDLLNMQVFT